MKELTRFEFLPPAWSDLSRLSRDRSDAIASEGTQGEEARIDGLVGQRGRNSSVSGKESNSVAFANSLLSEKRVSSVAGAHFGREREAHIRLSYTTPKQRIVEGWRGLGSLRPPRK